MAEYSKKWKTSFEKKFSKALNQVRELEKEYKEMVESNPDEWDLNWLFIDDATLEYDSASDLTVYHYDGEEEGTVPKLQVSHSNSIHLKN
jgi:ABC-type Zn uptake system ZnuABC Zn-binding protein ZnuA